MYPVYLFLYTFIVYFRFQPENKTNFSHRHLVQYLLKKCFVCRLGLDRNPGIFTGSFYSYVYSFKMQTSQSYFCYILSYRNIFLTMSNIKSFMELRLLMMKVGWFYPRLFKKFRWDASAYMNIKMSLVLRFIV